MKVNYCSAAEAVKLIKNGDHVYIQGSTSVPEVLCAALAERGSELRDVTLYQAFAVTKGEAPYCRPEFKDSFNVNTFFVANSVRKWIDEGLKPNPISVNISRVDLYNPGIVDFIINSVKFLFC